MAKDKVQKPKPIASVCGGEQILANRGQTEKKLKNEIRKNQIKEMSVTAVPIILLVSETRYSLGTSPLVEKGTQKTLVEIDREAE